MSVLVEGLTRFTSWLRRGQRVRTGDGIVKVNLGCGLSVAEGWINVDGSLNALLAGFPQTFQRLAYRATGAQAFFSEPEYLAILGKHTFVQHDLEHGVPFRDESVDFIFSSHFLEHLCYEQALDLLRESWRALKKGGILRICVPDLEFAVRLYAEGESRRALEYFFERSKKSRFRRHQYMYDFELLRDALKEAGFLKVSRCSYQVGEMPDLEILDNRPEETLYVEAEK